MPQLSQSTVMPTPAFVFFAPTRPICWDFRCRLMGRIHLPLIAPVAVEKRNEPLIQEPCGRLGPARKERAKAIRFGFRSIRSRGLQTRLPGLAVIELSLAQSFKALAMLPGPSLDATSVEASKSLE